MSELAMSFVAMWLLAFVYVVGTELYINRKKVLKKLDKVLTSLFDKR